MSTKDSEEKSQIIADLQRRNQVLESRISDLESMLEKITSSNSWRITSPLRVIGKLKRALTPFFRSRCHDVQIVDVQHLERDGDRYTISGPTPAIIFEVAARRPVSMWIALNYKTETENGYQSFAFYYDLGQGFKGENRKFLTLFNDQTQSSVVNLGSQAFKFRLDPFDREGSFILKDLSVTELGKFQVIVKFLRKHFKLLTLNPMRIFRLLSKVVKIYRDGGWASLRHKIFSGQNGDNYADWVNKYDTLNDVDRAMIKRHLDGLAYQPLISVVMPTYNTPERWLRKAIESVQGQVYSNWELCIADDCSTLPNVKEVLNDYASKDKRIKVTYRSTNGHIAAASNSALGLASGPYCAFLDHDDEFAPHALAVIVDAINKNRSAHLFYSDEDKITELGQRFNPYFKSDWNPELFLSQNFICHLTVCRTDLIKQVGGFNETLSGSQDWDLLLRVTEHLNEREIVHLPYILYHWRVIPESVAHGSSAKPYAIEAAKRAVESHLERTNERGNVEIIQSLSHLKVTFEIPTETPLVSLIILTKDKVKLLKKCVDSIFEKTTYPNYELIVVDNGSIEKETAEYLSKISVDARVRILRIEEPFNFSRLNNLAVKEAKGQIFGFLNNDLEVINSGWLTEMVSHACRPGVGAVGARLWFPNNLIQHAGVILGIGGTAGHGNKGIERGNPGYFNRAVLTQNFSAVTAACMLVPRMAFDGISGFNEKELSVAFNDVDFCLRLREKGYRIVYTPYAELYHYESASRGYETTPKKFARFERETEYMRKRWQDVLTRDPFYNPNLTLFNEDFSFAFPPRVLKPWREKKETQPLASSSQA